MSDGWPLLPAPITIAFLPFQAPPFWTWAKCMGMPAKLPRLDRHDRYGADPRREQGVPGFQHPLIRTPHVSADVTAFSLSGPLMNSVHTR